MDIRTLIDFLDELESRYEFMDKERVLGDYLSERLVPNLKRGREMDIEMIINNNLLCDIVKLVSVRVPNNIKIKYESLIIDVFVEWEVIIRDRLLKEYDNKRVYDRLLEIYVKYALIKIRFDISWMDTFKVIWKRLIDNSDMIELEINLAIDDDSILNQLFNMGDGMSNDSLTALMYVLKDLELYIYINLHNRLMPKYFMEMIMNNKKIIGIRNMNYCYPLNDVNPIYDVFRFCIPDFMEKLFRERELDYLGIKIREEFGYRLIEKTNIRRLVMDDRMGFVKKNLIDFIKQIQNENKVQSQDQSKNENRLELLEIDCNNWYVKHSRMLNIFKKIENRMNKEIRIYFFDRSYKKLF